MQARAADCTELYNRISWQATKLHLQARHLTRQIRPLHRPPHGRPCCMASAASCSSLARLSFLVDENAHAVHFFIAALLQLLDR